MKNPGCYMVTGAFGFSGKYIAQKLLSGSKSVRTLTNSKPGPADPNERLIIYPLNFNNNAVLVNAMEGCEVLFNTYWVRFNYKNFNHPLAVENTLKLFEAAKKAGIRKIVHTSITHPSENSKLSYFRGKAILEKELMNSGLSWSILRPAVLFGPEDILINNITWMVRHLPVFGIFGDGSYKLQPIFVEDFAEIAIREADKPENSIIEAIGPETFTYRELIQAIMQITGVKRPLIQVPGWMGLFTAKILGMLMQDVVITREEIEGLKSNLLYVDSKPAGKTRLTDLLRDHRDTIGTRYANEINKRHTQS